MNTKKKRTRDELIESHYVYAERVVKSLIRKFGLPPEGLDDLLAAGFLGLVEAAERYKQDSSVPFTNFAFLRIRGAVIDSIRRNSRITGKKYHALKALQGAYDMHEEYERVKSDLSKSDRLTLLLELGAKTFMSASLSYEQGGADEGIKNPEEVCLDKENYFNIRELVVHLPEKERFIIEEYYFKEKSFTQIAQENMKLSKSWVSRLHSRALSLLKQIAEEKEAREELLQHDKKKKRS